MDNKQDATGVKTNEVDTASNLIDVFRRFHYGEPAAAARTDLPPGGILPALLNAYRDASAIRYPYPLYLSPPGTDAALAQPVSEYFAAAIDAFSLGEDDARILKDNLPWIERYLRQKLSGADPADAAALFVEAAAEMQEQLELKPGGREKLEADLGRLAKSIAPGGQFIGYGPDVALYLLVHAIGHRQLERREGLRQRVAESVQALQALLQVEKAKSADASESLSVEKGVGAGARHLDADALSGILRHRSRGSTTMSEPRRARIEAALAELEAWQDDPVLVRFVGQVANPRIAELGAVDLVASDDPCTDASGVFSHEAERYARLFGALRIAALEADDGYDPGVHDSWFGSFDWQAFSDEELQLVTSVVALVSADQLAGEGLSAFSHLLGSRLPVHVLSTVRAYDNPAAKPGEDPFAGYRFELANFGIGHRQVVVAQASAARYEDLLSGFLTAIDSNRTSLHLVNRGTQSRVKKPLLDAWFVASAALESRAHPFLLVNPDAGDRAAQRVSFGGNPQADSDWPLEKLEYRGPDGEVTEMDLAFTFADYALLIPALHPHFRTVPAGFEAEDLVTVDRYLAAGGEQADRLVPFVWGIDEAGTLLRLVVSRALLFACRDRLNYWHTLQELAGIQNYYVEEAIDRIIAEQQTALETEREQLRREHEEQIESVRAEAADDAMGQLVDALMGADLSGMIADGRPLATMPAAEPTPAEEPAAPAGAAPEPVEEPEEEISFDEPWLDTASCTTCDDCMNINKLMFAYNEDKQAFIKDPRAGTYADLVEAAEICPAKCIHPGKPLDPNETGLEELIARAAPFN